MNAAEFWLTPLIAEERVAATFIDWQRTTEMETRPASSHSLVRAALEDGGLVVSDGSNAIEQLARQHRKEDPGADAHLQEAPFEYRSRRFTCIDSLTPKYGPTFVWQVVRI